MVVRRRIHSIPSIVVALALIPGLASAAEPAAAEAPPAVDTSEDDQRRIVVGGVLGGLGIALGATAAGLTHHALNVPCDTSKDVLECEEPSVSNLASRRVAIGVAGWAMVAGPILGGLGGGRLTRGLAGQVQDAEVPKLRKAAVGTGWGLVGLGLATTVAGTTMFTLGLRGATESVTPSDGSEAEDAVQRREVRDRLGHVKVARSGLALAMVSPTLIATGAAVLYRTRKHIEPRNTRLSFALSPNYAGLSLSGRF